MNAFAHAINAAAPWVERACWILILGAVPAWLVLPRLGRACRPLTRKARKLAAACLDLLDGFRPGRHGPARRKACTCQGCLQGAPSDAEMDDWFAMERNFPAPRRGES